jgi:hypothetical protein
MEKAKASFTEAMDALSQVKSRDDAVELFRKNLEHAVAVMSGKAAEPKTVDAPATDAPMAEPSAPPARAGKARGFSSPEELIKYIQSNAAKGDAIDNLRIINEITYAEAPDGIAMKTATDQMVGALQTFSDAMSRKFGEEVKQAMNAGMMAAMPVFDTRKISERTDARVVIAVSSKGRDRNVALKNIGGLWYVDGDEMAAHSRGVQATAAEMTKFKDLIQDVVQRMNAGTLNDPRQIMEEVQEAFANVDFS